jgi:hypothetical protein
MSTSTPTLPTTTGRRKRSLTWWLNTPTSTTIQRSPTTTSPTRIRTWSTFGRATSTTTPGQTPRPDSDLGDRRRTHPVPRHHGGFGRHPEEFELFRRAVVRRLHNAKDWAPLKDPLRPGHADRPELGRQARPPTCPAPLRKAVHLCGSPWHKALVIAAHPLAPRTLQVCGLAGALGFSRTLPPGSARPADPVSLTWRWGPTRSV